MTSILLDKHKIASAVVLYAICFTVAWFTELLASVPGNGISIWLPAGCLFAAALASNIRSWPLWAGAAIAAEFTGNALWYHHAVGPIALLSFGNVTAALLGAYIVRRATRPTFIFSSISSTAVFIGVTIFILPVISATIASAGLGWSYRTDPFAAWQRILLGDAVGAIVGAPFFLTLLGVAAPWPRMSKTKWFEATILLFVFAGMAALSLSGVAPFAFLMIPLLIWAALRFRVVGAVMAVVALTLFTALFTLAGASPFAPTLNGARLSHEGLQLFLLVASITALMMAALAEENLNALKKLRVANQLLGSRAEESEADAKTAAGLLNAIGEASPNLIYAKDLNFDLIYANSATLEALGAKSLSELKTIGEAGYYDVEGEFQKIRDNDRQVIESGKTLVVEEEVTDDTGNKRVYRTTKAPLFDNMGILKGLAGVSVDISDIKRAQLRERMLVREVDHRSRNLLAVAQGIVNLTNAETVSEFKKAFGRRLNALARTNGAIAAASWSGASLQKIIEEEIAPYNHSEWKNIVIIGSDVELDPSTAQSLTLVLHELATNAAKYGALSAETGKLSVTWDVVNSGNRHRVINLVWSERGGPKVTAPQTEGFGSTMIRLFGEEQPDSQISMAWDPEGLSVSLTIVSSVRKHPAINSQNSPILQSF